MNTVLRIEMSDFLTDTSVAHCAAKECRHNYAWKCGYKTIIISPTGGCARFEEEMEDGDE